MVCSARNVAVGLIFTTLLAARSVAAPTSQPDRELVPPISAEDQKVENLLDHHLPAVHLPGVSLTDSIDFIRDITGANIYVDWKAVELAGITKDARVTVDGTDISIRGVFKTILEATGSDALKIQVIQGVIVVSTKLDFADRKNQPGPYLAGPSDATQSGSILDKRLAQFTLTPNTLDDAYQLLQDLGDVPIIMKWKPLAVAGVDRNTKVSLNLHDARVASVLYFVLTQAGDGKLGYIIQPREAMVYDKVLQKRVLKRTAAIIISTIDDLEANNSNPTTLPN
jgi:hypothetical protein